MHGYILHQEKVAQSSMQITLLGQDDVVLSVRLHRMSAHMRAYLRPFCLLDVELSHNQAFLNRLEPSGAMTHLLGNPLSMAWYLNELLVYIVKPFEHVEGIYDLYTHTLQILAQNKNLDAMSDALRIFEKHLLQSLGFAIDFMHAPLGQSYRKETLLAMQTEIFNEQTRQEAKYLMRDILKPYLRGKILKSRTLWQKETSVEC